MTVVRSRMLRAVVMALAGVPAGLALAHGDSPLVRWLGIAVLLVVPGAALAALLPSLRTPGKVVCGLAAGLGLNGLVAEAMLAFGVWSLLGGATAVTVIGAGLWFLAGQLGTGATGSAGPEGGDRVPAPAAGRVAR